MARGFIFDYGKCVACGSCNAACVLENGWTIQPRSIYKSNPDALPTFPLINLSMACNHCESAACMQGCPASAYTREPVCNSIVIDDDKCLGCRYCEWNCPYNAPKFDTNKKTIGKCNLCYSRISEGHLPSCSTACPTGALGYGELFFPVPGKAPSWFPDKKLNPLINFISDQNIIPVRIIPETISCKETTESIKAGRIRSDDWSLFVFSFLTTISVSINISSLFKSTFPDMILTAALLIIAGLISLLHLGKKLRAWRVISGVFTSPLSREIALFILYSVFSLSAAVFQIPGVLLASSVLGLILLAAIDSVYIFSDRRKSVVFHSGQTFISALLIISFFTSAALPFMFIAALRLVSSIRMMITNGNNNIDFGIRFLRTALLIITGGTFFSGISNSHSIIISIFLTGELLDRILFYYDFEPVSLASIISKNINKTNNEKKRG